MQSNQGLDVDQSFEVNVGVMRGAEAGGGSGNSLKITNTDLQSQNCTIKKKKSMVYIPEVDGEFLCAARAIVTCTAKLRKMAPKDYKMLINLNNVNSSNPSSQRMRAISLHRDAGVPMNRPVPVTDLHMFEKKLNVQIVVVSGDNDNEIVYKGHSVLKDKIFLYLKDQHFHSIINIKGFYVNQNM